MTIRPYRPARQVPQIQVVIDRLTICYREPNAAHVDATRRLLLSERYRRDIPGLQISGNGRYAVRAKIPVPFMTTSPDRHPIFFEACPRLARLPSYRLDFNPTKLSQQGLDDVRLLLTEFTDAGPEMFFRLGRVTRVDAAVDMPGLTINDVIVLARRKQKRGVYVDRHGVPETTYIGTPRSARVAAYTKINEQTGEVAVRVECRLKPNFVGRDLVRLPNPFQGVRLLRVQVLDGLVRGIPGQLIADSIRLRGPNHALTVLDARSRQKVLAALSRPSLLPDADALWAGWPNALRRVGLGWKLGAEQAAA